MLEPDANIGCYVIGLMNAISCKAGISGDPATTVLEPESGFQVPGIVHTYILLYRTAKQ